MKSHSMLFIVNEIWLSLRIRLPCKLDFIWNKLVFSADFVLVHCQKTLKYKQMSFLIYTNNNEVVWKVFFSKNNDSEVLITFSLWINCKKDCLSLQWQNTKNRIIWCVLRIFYSEQLEQMLLKLDKIYGYTLSSINWYIQVLITPQRSDW